MAEDKIFKYRGKTIEELKDMKIDELAQIFPSRVRRKITRGFTEQEGILLKKFQSGEKKIRTHCRDMIVLPEMVGNKIQIYNGKEFVEVTIVPEMIPLRFGELVPTRRIASHSGMGNKKTVVRK